MKILIASDHAGIDLKTTMKTWKELGVTVEWEDLGPSTKDSVDYPDFADLVARRVNQDPQLRGILICGSGQGMAMRANKYPQVRAALCWNEEIAQLSRQHNDANILCLGARSLTPELAQKIVKTFLTTPFEGGRHSTRVAKVSRAP